MINTTLLAANDGLRIINPVLPEDLTNMEGRTFLQNFLNLGINLGFIIGAIIFFFMLTSGAIKWISSSGDKTKLETAQKQITSALTGLAILFCIFAIIKLIETLFGISITKFNLPTL